jgi:hypothetical protein
MVKLQFLVLECCPKLLESYSTNCWRYIPKLASHFETTMVTLQSSGKTALVHLQRETELCLTLKKKSLDNGELFHVHLQWSDQTPLRNNVNMLSDGTRHFHGAKHARLSCLYWLCGSAFQRFSLCLYKWSIIMFCTQKLCTVTAYKLCKCVISNSYTNLRSEHLQHQTVIAQCVGLSL